MKALMDEGATILIFSIIFIAMEASTDEKTTVYLP